MKQASRQGSRKTSDGLNYKQHSKHDYKDDLIDDQDCVEEDVQQVANRDEEEDDYMTNQEKLWNAIESQLGPRSVEDLLKRSDV